MGLTGIIREQGEVEHEPASSTSRPKGGLKMKSKNVLKKWFRSVPKWTPKVDQNRQKGCSGGVSKRDLKNGPSPGPGKVRFCCYLLHFSKVGGLKKDTFLGTILGPFGRQNR